MSLAEMLKKSRELKEVSKQDLAKALSIPTTIVSYLEEAEKFQDELISLLASALEIPVDVFKGEATLEPPEPTEEELKEAIVKKAKYPYIRAYILDPEICVNPEAAMKLFGDQELSLAEQNVILYLSTTALYHFCDTNYSSFAFDTYLFKLHGTLLKKFEEDLKHLSLSAEEREERLGNARANVFSCDTIENIAIHVFKQFAEEMEQKLAEEVHDFKEDLDLPMTWNVDDKLMKIEIVDSKGTIRDEIKLLDVKERNK